MIERWTEGAENLLRQLWNDERRTARECAKVLGVTRNAVIGKVHRMHLSRRASPVLAKLSAERRRASTLWKNSNFTPLRLSSR